MENSKYADEAPEATPHISTQHPQTTSGLPASSDPHAAPVDAMDQFAQTRAPDDLFDDDFTPVAKPVEEIHPPVGPRGRGGRVPRGPRGQQDRGGRGGRGRGRGTEPTSSVSAPASASAPAPVPAPAPTSTSTSMSTPQPQQGDQQSKPVTESNGTAEPKKEGAVRGDRSATGGVKKAKFTEDELNAKLASMKVKNAAAEEAHRRQQADEDSFRAREQAEQVKRLEERQNRREMDKEREKNRARKLKAVGGREWDAEKKEEDYAGGQRREQFRRGAYGGVVGDQRRSEAIEGQDTEEKHPQNSSRGSRGGRSGRGSGPGRGRGRGALNSSSKPDAHVNKEGPPNSGEFPALPASKVENKDGERPKVTEVKKKTSAPTEPLKSPNPGDQSWAEEVQNTVDKADAS